MTYWHCHRKIRNFLPISKRNEMKRWRKNYDDNNNYITSISYEFTRTNASANERACCVVLYCIWRCYCAIVCSASEEQHEIKYIYHSFGGKNVFKITYKYNLYVLRISMRKLLAVGISVRWKSHSQNIQQNGLVCI